MIKTRPIPGVVLLIAALLSLVLAGIQAFSHDAPSWAALAADAVLLAACFTAMSPTMAVWRWLTLMALLAIGAVVLASLTDEGLDGATLTALALLAGVSVQGLARLAGRHLPEGAVALLFGVWVLYFWQLLVTWFAIPQVLLPTPLDILQALFGSASLLAGDVVQTVLKSVLAGYLLGSGLGIAVAMLIDRLPFLQRGLLPLANLTSTIPLVGVAPIAVMWFGFDWPSKAAVIVLVTFFPALVSTLAGLRASGKLERELMYCYAASPRRTLWALRLPAALPFIFSALKVNATLALISAIVAEFFGSPTAGLGFRISTEAARMHMSIVWAAIVVASAIGSLVYALLVRLERKVNFWHPSVRGVS
ncbi:ABC transporter permease [Musicola paradisiaca]|uniref:Binding-protein-dependent transport systems inner membrane component n=1 Tax=Musicola paradisiaca (strain Ech703) TaxID=579405 RepID=C6C5P3_MUSP7|nr:ABC transporter permease [Musicola paradisiaca]ACS83856.1 binding-protein-dependent transport systems inner membrane component [Musicola paradisiaca Ech703]